MKLYKKIASLLAVAALAAVLMPVCMAAPGDSIETRLNHAFASTEFYEEVVTTSPDGTTQTMTAARSNGNAYIKMDMGEAGQLVYILKDGQGYLVDAASKLAVKGEVPTVTVSEEAVSGEAQAIPCTETTMNVNGQDCEYVVTDAAEGRTIVEYRVTSTSVDQNLFIIPADYQIMTQEELAAQMGQ